MTVGKLYTYVLWYFTIYNDPKVYGILLN